MAKFTIGESPQTYWNPARRWVAWSMHTAPHLLMAWIANRRRATAVMVALSVTFAGLALVAANAEFVLLEFDQVVQKTAIGSRVGWLDRLMVVLTFLGTRWVIGGLAVVIGIWALVARRCRVTVVVLAVAVLINPVVEVAFKELIGRGRPDLAQLLPGRGPSFPSGHVLASVGFYGLLPLLTWDATTRYGIRRLVFFSCLGIVGIVAVSRVYIDVHWTSDVVAGLLLGGVAVTATYHALRGHGLHLSKSCCTPARVLEGTKLPA